MLTQDDIRGALRACYGAARPYQRPQNIVDLGLVQSIVLAPDREAPGAGIPGVPQKFSLTLTLYPPSPDEDAQIILRSQVANRLAGLPELSRATILFTDKPSPFRIL